MANKKTKTTAGTILAVVIALALFAAQQMGWIESTGDPQAAPGARQTSSTPSATRDRDDLPEAYPGSTPEPPGRFELPGPDDVHPITRLQRQGATNTPVTGSGVIVKVLSDDNEGSRHQRFLVDLYDGHTIKISHNIDLAPRVPNPREGDELTFKGDFEANELGGVVHWTHHDPRGRHEPGYLIYKGQKYE
ncbi:MAG: DUF3465 domain-containing protein [Planctomycetota bacterium]